MRMHTRIAAVVLIGLSTAIVVRSAFSKEEAASGSPVDMAEMMKKCMEAATPGEMHKHLEPFVGSWKTTTKAWMPGAPEPSVSTGTAKVQWTLGGRYVSEIHKSTFQMPGPDGKMTDYDFEGHGLTGYDNLKKQYLFAWADNMSTALLTGLGTFDPKTKTLTSYGQMDDAMTDVRGKAVKYVHQILSNDKQVFEMYDLGDGVDGKKMLEVTYERTK